MPAIKKREPSIKNGGIVLMAIKMPKYVDPQTMNNAVKAAIINDLAGFLDDRISVIMIKTKLVLKARN